MSTTPTHSARASAPTRRRSASTPRAAYRNEVRTRLDDPAYEALLVFQQIHGIDSVSSALARVVKAHLLGMVGMLPVEISGVSAAVSQVETHA